MSIDTSAKIMIGLPRNEVDEDLIDNEDLEVASPYYDGYGENYAIAGFAIHRSGNYSPVEISWDAVKIGELMRKFRELTGKEAKVWLTPHVS